MDLHGFTGTVEGPLPTPRLWAATSVSLLSTFAILLFPPHPTHDSLGNSPHSADLCPSCVVGGRFSKGQRTLEFRPSRSCKGPSRGGLACAGPPPRRDGSARSSRASPRNHRRRHTSSPCHMLRHMVWSAGSGRCLLGQVRCKVPGRVTTTAQDTPSQSSASPLFVHGPSAQQHLEGVAPPRGECSANRQLGVLHKKLTTH